MMIPIYQYCQRLTIELLSPFFHEQSHHKANIMSHGDVIQRVVFYSDAVLKQVVTFSEPVWITGVDSIDDIRVTVDDSKVSLEASVEGIIQTSAHRS